MTQKQKPKPKTDTQARPLSQKEILSSVIKRKSTTETSTTDIQLQKKVKTNSNETALIPHALLPGLGNYDSSDSDDSSELSDSDCQQRSDIDWMGRKIVKVAKGCDE